MGELDEVGIHVSVAGFIVWLIRQDVARAKRHAFPSVVVDFLRWRHARLVAGHDCDREEFVASLPDRHTSEQDRRIAEDAIDHYARYLADEPS